MTWTIETSKGFESDKIKYLIVPYTRGDGLDLGCGVKRAWPHFIGVDNGHHFGAGDAGVIVKTCEDLSDYADGSMDFVFSSHLLEHIENTEAALREWWRVIKPGGHLVLYLPHKNFYPNIGQPGANPDHKHDFLPGDIVRAMTSVDVIANGAWDQLVEEERGGGDEYSFFQVYRKLDKDGDGECRYSWMDEHEKTICICRFGGFGDMLQMSSVLPELKRQGYHITIMTTPRGKEPMAHDPHVDAWLVQDTDQVPNEELCQYWAAWESRFDKFVNLSESVEASAIAYPGRPQYFWNKKAREMLYGNVRYLELQHAIVGVPYKPAVKFYPNEDERAWVCEQFREIGKGRPVILWSLAGSSFHKAYPWTDSVIARVMLETNAVVVLTGDEVCQILEGGWENESRVVCTSGKWSIRQSLAFAQHASIVIGPETGVLNSVAYEKDVLKILMLSHSGSKNLCDDWVRTVALKPIECPCYPCHMMHLSRNTCVEDEETGAALCAARISPDRVFDEIKKFLKKVKK